ncbi:MAG: 2-C-methyl-D-erythritol 2,4-cyclodiphosphate synthase [Acidobacteria bacterium]|nr:2-C-methyl-D-erythritol 2,4-cyclodiphosphate synthase [Acidobacteriota bacterium]
MYRVGIGYDYHRLAEDRKLIIGGVEIPYSMGLIGHSDADVLLHAICDALLGAAALGDIGEHFPSSDETLQNVDSRLLLRKVDELLGAAHYRIVNIDCVITAERPRLAPYFARMIEEISRTLRIDQGQVSVKATTTDGMDDVGRGVGISARAVAMVNRRELV